MHSCLIGLNAVSAVTTALIGTHHVNRVETPGHAVYPAFLAADQRVHDLHAGELGQCHEPCPLDDCIPHRFAHRTPGRTLDLHACAETLRASIRKCPCRRLPDDGRRRLFAREPLWHPLCRAHRDGCYFRSPHAGCLISLRKPRASPSGGMDSGFRIVCPLTSVGITAVAAVSARRTTSRGKRKA